MHRFWMLGLKTGQFKCAEKTNLNFKHFSDRKKPLTKGEGL